jgi:hypothetical protein
MKGFESESTLIEWQVMIISCPKKEESLLLLLPVIHLVDTLSNTNASNPFHNLGIQSFGQKNNISLD